MKITDHQKLKYVRNFGGTLIKEYFWGSRVHALETPSGSNSNTSNPSDPNLSNQNSHFPREKNKQNLISNVHL